MRPQSTSYLAVTTEILPSSFLGSVSWESVRSWFNQSKLFLVEMKMGPTCPQCGVELIMDVRSFSLLVVVKVWTDYVCPNCARRYEVAELVKAIRAKRQER
jgi:DNA-directed RNA polymerase subunit RPC12/RpoP